MRKLAAHFVPKHPATFIPRERQVYVVINGRARLHAIVVPAWQAMAIRSAAEAFRRERTTVVQS